MKTLVGRTSIILFLLALALVALACEVTSGPTEQETDPGTVTPELTSTPSLPPNSAPITHFIAVGDRPIGASTPPVFRYSLEYWQCGGDYSSLNHTAGFTPAQIVANCKALNPGAVPQKLGEVELLARTGWMVWGGGDDRTGTGKSWVEQGVSIGEIIFTGTGATALMPIYTGTAAAVQNKWETIIDIATNYQWAEQSGFASVPTFTQWPRSMYMVTQTNGNTFVRYLVTTSGLTMTEMDGLQIGDSTPKQNRDTYLKRQVKLYEAHTPWDPGGPAKPKPPGFPS